MKVKQAKLASALRGETSNIINSDKYDLSFEKGILYAALKHSAKVGPFAVFPANIAYLEYEEITEVEVPTTQPAEQTIAPKPKGRAKK